METMRRVRVTVGGTSHSYKMLIVLHNGGRGGCALIEEKPTRPGWEVCALGADLKCCPFSCLSTRGTARCHGKTNTLIIRARGPRQHLAGHQPCSPRPHPSPWPVTISSILSPWPNCLLTESLFLPFQGSWQVRGRADLTGTHCFPYRWQHWNERPRTIQPGLCFIGSSSDRHPALRCPQPFPAVSALSNPLGPFQVKLFPPRIVQGKGEVARTPAAWPDCLPKKQQTETPQGNKPPRVLIQPSLEPP